MIREIGNGLTVHCVDGAILYASQGYRILRSADAGERWEADGAARAPVWRKALGRLGTLHRISRGGISGVLPLKDGSRLCVAPKVIQRAESESSVYSPVLEVSRGSRPLSLCLGSNGNIFWGEYFLNLKRSEPVHVFGSKNGGRSWEIVHSFQKGLICHIHRIVHDPFGDAILVCTGDRDEESAIFETRDDFLSLKPLVQGSQMYRTACLVPQEQCILYGTDNPSGQNAIMSLDRKSGRVRTVQNLPGPVISGASVGEHIIFSTMVEKQHHEVTLWMGNDDRFQLLAQFESRKIHRAWRELAGYPRAILPEGRGEWPFLYVTPVGTKRYANSLLRFDLSNGTWPVYL